MAHQNHSLDVFVAEVQYDIQKFVVAYRARRLANPEHYPLTLNESNAGLWFEFFMSYCQSGEV